MNSWRRPGRGGEPTHEGQVPAATIHGHFEAKLAPELLPRGFEEVTPQKWVRSTFAPIRHVLEIHTLKSGIYTPFWYLSLDFVPHLTSSKVTWHRTPKSAHPDLRYDPLDRIERSRWHEEVDAWCVNPRGSLRSVVGAVERLTSWSVPRAEHWLNQAHAVEQLPDLFREAEQESTHRFGFKNYYKQRLAWAFALAACGREVEAHDQFTAWLEREDGQLAEEQRSILKQRFAAAVAGGGPRTS